MASGAELSKSAVVALLTLATVGAAPVATRASGTLPVTVQFERPTSQATLPGLIGRSRLLAVPQPRGEPARRDLLYAYRPLDGTAMAAVPLTLDYRDGRDDQGLGLGWTLLYTPVEGIAVDLLRPDIALLTTGSDRVAEFANRLAPLRSVGDKLILDLPAAAGELALDEFAQDRAVVAAHTQADGTSITFTYEVTGEKTLWRAVSNGAQTLRISRPDRDAAILALDDGRAVELALSEVPGHAVTQLTAVDDGLVTPARKLEFRYAPSGHGLHADAAPATRCAGAQASAWHRIGSRDDPSRWRLPLDLNVAVHQGLEFMHIDRDGLVDLVATSDRRRGAWRSQDGGGNWTPHPLYALLRDHVTRGRTMGSRFAEIWKDYDEPFKRKRDTAGFSSIVESYYVPDPEQPETRLVQVSRVLFPVVDANRGDIDADENGEIWDIDPDPALALPMPLQYEGFDAFAGWPPVGSDPTLATFEHSGNQGAQLTTSGGRPALRFAGQCYRDALTGAPLLAVHRCTGNCRFRYTDQWGPRQVEVFLCQAFWRADSRKWRLGRYDVETNPFWIREDVGPDGEALDRFILPWGDDDPLTDDAQFRFHIEGLRNVRFVTLKARVQHAVVMGEAFASDNPAAANRVRPEARVFWVFDDLENRWHRDRDPRLALPEDIARQPQKEFLDVDGDGLDDVIMLADGERHVFLNTIQTATASGWTSCPAYQLPIECRNLRRCRFLELDSDRSIDILVDDGSVVYLNRRAQVSQPLELTAFTNDAGMLTER